MNVFTQCVHRKEHKISANNIHHTSKQFLSRHLVNITMFLCTKLITASASHSRSKQIVTRHYLNSCEYLSTTYDKCKMYNSDSKKYSQIRQYNVKYQMLIHVYIYIDRPYTTNWKLYNKSHMILPKQTNPIIMISHYRLQDIIHYPPCTCDPLQDRIHLLLYDHFFNFQILRASLVCLWNVGQFDIDTIRYLSSMKTNATTRALYLIYISNK